MCMHVVVTIVSVEVKRMSRICDNGPVWVKALFLFRVSDYVSIGMILLLMTMTEYVIMIRFCL